MIPVARHFALVTLLYPLLWFAATESGHAGPDEATGRIVAVGDVHGDFDSLTAILRTSGIVDSKLSWIGGETTLVQTGDFLDRGPSSRRVMDLLKKLEKEASRAGGQVLVMLGNHEIMNLIGDYRYLAPEDYSDFANKNSQKNREKAFEQYRKFLVKRARELEQPEPSFSSEFKDQWLQAHPPGFFERQENFEKGEYGKWLRERPAAARVNDILFLHGGIHPNLADLSLEQLNQRVEQELDAFRDYKKQLTRMNVILPFFTLQEIAEAVQFRLEAMRQARQEATLDSTHEKPVSPEEQFLESFLETGSWFIRHPDGPFWYRGYAEWDEPEGSRLVPPLLAALGVSHLVVGHTTFPDGIRSRFAGKIFLIDTGMTYQREGTGRPAALEIKDGTFTAVYSDRSKVLYGNRVDSGEELRTLP